MKQENASIEMEMLHDAKSKDEKQIQSNADKTKKTKDEKQVRSTVSKEKKIGNDNKSKKKSSKVAEKTTVDSTDTKKNAGEHNINRKDELKKSPSKNSKNKSNSSKVASSNDNTEAHASDSGKSDIVIFKKADDKEHEMSAICENTDDRVENDTLTFKELQAQENIDKSEAKKSDVNADEVEKKKAEYKESKSEFSDPDANEKKHVDEGLRLKESTAVLEVQLLDPMIFADPSESKVNDNYKSSDLPSDDAENSDKLSLDCKNAIDDNWDDEFSDIPDSYTEDEDTAILTDDAGTISSLLYIDEDNEYEPERISKEAVSFAQLRQDMQRLKEEVKELHGCEDEEVFDSEGEILGQLAIEDPDDTQGYTDQEENDTDSDNANEDPITEDHSVSDDEEPSGDEAKDTSDNIESNCEETEKKSAKEQTAVAIVDEKKETPREHIITIDRKRVAQKEEKQERAIDSAHEVISIFVFTLMAMLLITAFLFRHTVVEGSSMNNTLHDGDYLIISDLFYTPKRSDIVVCDETGIEDHDSYGINAPVVKRIIALGDDTVKIENGIIYVNGEILDESEYINVLPEQTMAEITVPKGKIFVMGDNRRSSCDSEEFGCVDEDAIIGRVVFRFYPFDSIKLFK